LDPGHPASYYSAARHITERNYFAFDLLFLPFILLTNSAINTIRCVRPDLIAGFPGRKSECRGRHDHHHRRHHQRYGQHQKDTLQSDTSFPSKVAGCTTGSLRPSGTLHSGRSSKPLPLLLIRITWSRRFVYSTFVSFPGVYGPGHPTLRLLV
jgi:hypothetical protein